MNRQMITSEDLYKAFMVGATQTINERYVLNKLNVFPVADNDTGTNLSFTMQTIKDETILARTPKETLGSIAEAAITGARGNSGIIFAQFINGLHAGMSEEKEISIKDFSKAVNQGVFHAYESIANPVEGTIVTVMYDWSESLNELMVESKDFAETFHLSIAAAIQSVKDTPEKLKVLRDASVVDAGGKGFVYFLEGMSRSFLNLETNVSEYVAAVQEESIAYEEHIHTIDKDEDISHRYCTEVLLSGTRMQIEAIKQAVEEYGDSLIVAGGPTKVRIHIHTNTPAIIFEKIKQFGNVTQQKVDDMQRQFQSAHARNSSIALVTDSIADLPKELMDQHQIHMLPLNILIGNSSYLDKVTISPPYLYEMMDSEEDYPTSSQPTVKTAERYLNTLLANYESIIMVTVSGKMSGTYEVLCKAAENLDLTGEKITVIDSKLNSGGQGLVVLKAAEEIANGKFHKEVVETIYQAIEDTKIFVSVDTLKYMVRSGRIKTSVGLMAKLLNVKPVVSIDEHGDGIVIGNAFSVNGNAKKIQTLVADILKKKKISNYAIVHADSYERALEFEVIFTKIMNKAPTYITEISSIVAMNAGLGCVAIAFTTE